VNPGHPARPAATPPERIDFVPFWATLGRVLVRLLKERAHGQVVLTIHNGDVVLVDINRKYKPTGLPDV
jgi:hypothetical protein